LRLLSSPAIGRRVSVHHLFAAKEPRLHYARRTAGDAFLRRSAAGMRKHMSMSEDISRFIPAQFHIGKILT
jgi:hypothetical protein